MTSTVRQISAAVKNQPMANPQTENPELSDVLLGTCSAPWTLSEFARFLEKNYCSEVLQFTTNVMAYRQQYESKPFRDDACSRASHTAATSARWQSLLDTYIRPDAEREINIPSSTRNALLAYQDPRDPPPPSVLQTAYDSMIELMRGVFVQYVESVMPCRCTETLE